MLLAASWLESYGLWFIGIGAFVVAVSAIVGGRLASGMRLGVTHSREGRLTYAGLGAGGVWVAMGSILVAIEHFQPVPVISTVLGLPLVAWVLAAWSIRASNRRMRAEFEDGLSNYPEQRASLEWEIRVAERRMAWRWALLHVFSSDAKDRADAEQRFGPMPSPHPEAATS